MRFRKYTIDLSDIHTIVWIVLFIYLFLCYLDVIRQNHELRDKIQLLGGQ